MSALLLFALLMLVVTARPGSAGDVEEELTVCSPGGRLALTFAAAGPGALDHWMNYRVTYDGRPLVEPSPLGMKLAGGADLGRGVEVVSAEPGATRQTWTPVYGERSEIPDRCNELRVALRTTTAPVVNFSVTFRAYDEGVALRYEVPKQEGLDQVTVEREWTHFRFAADHSAWAVYSAQGEYKQVPLSGIGPNCERPLTLETAAGPVVAVGEANLVDFARMRLSPAEAFPYCLVSALAGPVVSPTPLVTPWRFVMVGDTPGELIEHNYLLLNLSDPCALADTSWIKPGKIIREVTLTTAGGKACVDFAAAHNLQYIEYDAGWYGHEYDDHADATRVSVDPKRSKGPLDLPAVIEYAKSRGLGVWLYVNRRALERQLDQLLPLFQQWGVAGVKFGFVQVGSQRWTAWLHEAVRKAAAHRLMVDIHDEYRPTGFSRTYPNLLTQEGIRGNECMPPAWHNLVLPFTRGLCGAGDYTICYYCDRIQTTHAHQLAASIVYYSPLQFMFWYDRPSAFQGEPEVELFDRLPTVWDDTRVLHGHIGEFVTIARRRGQDWYVATMNNEHPRRLSVPLSFLPAGRSYTATLYADGGERIETRTHVSLEQRRVTADTVLEVDLLASGGHVAWLTPAG